MVLLGKCEGIRFLEYLQSSLEPLKEILHDIHIELITIANGTVQEYERNKRCEALHGYVASLRNYTDSVQYCNYRILEGEPEKVVINKHWVLTIRSFSAGHVYPDGLVCSTQDQCIRSLISTSTVIDDLARYCNIIEEYIRSLRELREPEGRNVICYYWYVILSILALLLLLPLVWLSLRY